MIVSPCISVCKMDEDSRFCAGCARTSEEKILWKDKNTTNEWKQNNLMIIKKRMDANCLAIFKDSYEFKLKNGISLIKKKKIDEQK